jgi:hypothetical protein
MFCHSPIKNSSVEQKVILIIQKDLQLIHKTLPQSIERHNILRNTEVCDNVYDELRVGAVRSATQILAQTVNIKGPEPTSPRQAGSEVTTVRDDKLRIWSFLLATAKFRFSCTRSWLATVYASILSNTDSNLEQKTGCPGSVLYTQSSRLGVSKLRAEDRMRITKLCYADHGTHL